MPGLTIKNKRLKMSPNGIITLPVSARKALGMVKDNPTKVSISSDGKCVTLALSKTNSENVYRVSKSGLTCLKGKAKEVLSASKNRHYWMKLDDNKKEVKLMPF